MKIIVALVMMAMAAVTIDAAATVYTSSISLPKKRVLVALNKEADKKDYSKFLGAVNSIAEVTYTTGQKEIKKYGEWLFDSIISLGASTDVSDSLLEFVDAGNNLFIIAKTDIDNSKGLTERMRNIAVDCGIMFSESNVEDNFEGKKDGSDKKDLITANAFVNSKPVVKASTAAVVHQGLGLQIEDENPLLIPILSAEATSYVPESHGVPASYGNNVVLVAGMQTRIGSRATFAGSSAMFSDKHWSKNGDFTKSVLSWALQFRGVLRYRDVEHVKLVEGKEVRDGETYRIRDNVRYTVIVEEFVDTEWVPFVAPKEDPIQIDFTMIDPYVRADLSHVGNGKYQLDFKAPDVYGIFKFVVDYRRAGYNALLFKNQAVIRPLKLNEYERFIPAAYPYYVGTFSAAIGFVLLGLAFLYSKDE